MPAPRKLDLIPTDLRERLKQLLEKRGFADIVEVTEELNFWLDGEGLELRIGKTAVGEYSKLLKDQREAFGMAETLLADMDIQAEGDLHRSLMQMIAVSAMQMMQAVRTADGTLEPKDLMQLAKMLKDLMGSAGIREKLLADDEARIDRLARQKAAADVEKSSAELGLTVETTQQVKALILGVSA
jgi:uncharacterized protein DUF3486